MSHPNYSMEPNESDNDENDNNKVQEKKLKEEEEEEEEISDQKLEDRSTQNGLPPSIPPPLPPNIPSQTPVHLSSQNLFQEMTDFVNNNGLRPAEIKISITQNDIEEDLNSELMRKIALRTNDLSANEKILLEFAEEVKSFYFDSFPKIKKLYSKLQNIEKQVGLVGRQQSRLLAKIGWPEFQVVGIKQLCLEIESIEKIITNASRYITAINASASSTVSQTSTNSSSIKSTHSKTATQTNSNNIAATNAKQSPILNKIASFNNLSSNNINRTNNNIKTVTSTIQSQPNYNTIVEHISALGSIAPRLAQFEKTALYYDLGLKEKTSCDYLLKLVDSNQLELFQKAFLLEFDSWYKIASSRNTLEMNTRVKQSYSRLTSLITSCLKCNAAARPTKLIEEARSIVQKLIKQYSNILNIKLESSTNFSEWSDMKLIFGTSKNLKEEMDSKEISTAQVSNEEQLDSKVVSFLKNAKEETAEEMKNCM